MLFILHEDKSNFFLEPLKEPSGMTDKFWSSILTQLHARNAERPTMGRDDPPVAYFLSTKCSQHEVLVELFLFIYFKKLHTHTHLGFRFLFSSILWSVSPSTAPQHFITWPTLAFSSSVFREELIQALRTL